MQDPKDTQEHTDKDTAASESVHDTHAAAGADAKADVKADAVAAKADAKADATSSDAESKNDAPEKEEQRFLNDEKEFKAAKAAKAKEEAKKAKDNKAAGNGKETHADDKHHAHVAKAAHAHKKFGAASIKRHSISHNAGVTRLLWGASILVVLIVGVLLGHFVPMGSFGTQQLAGKVALSDSDLSSVVAQYEYDGKHYDVTAKQIITSKASLEKAKQPDGTYKAPTPEDITNYVRGQVLKLDAEKQGLTATDDEIAAQAKKMTGTDSVQSIAEKYGLEEDTMKDLISLSVLLDKLRASKVSGEEPKDPQPPAAPAKGKEKEPTADYAKFIINLAGDEWDADKNTWKAPDGPYATALKDFTITNDAATYDAAKAAFGVVTQQNKKVKDELNKEWLTYINGVLSHTSITINMLNS